jgi:hypothetical protein
MKGIHLKLLLPVATISIFASLCVGQRSYRSGDLMEPSLHISTNGSGRDLIELEHLLEGTNPAFLAVGRRLRALYEIEQLEDGEVLASTLYDNGLVRFFESEQIEYFVGYCEPDSLRAALGHRHVCAGRDINARLGSFRKPFFSDFDIKVVVYKNLDGRVSGHSIRGD